jgi:hypothetical protein
MISLLRLTNSITISLDLNPANIAIAVNRSAFMTFDATS